MRFLLRWCPLGLALLAGLVGCTNNPSASPQAKNQPHNPPAKSSAGDNQTVSQTNDAVITVKPVTWAGYQDTIKSLKGKVVVVDFWQTT